MIVDSVTRFRIDKQREKQGYLSHEIGIAVDSSIYNSQYNNQDIKRPLNNNPSDLSFKGLSFIPMYKKVGEYSKAEFLEFSKKHLYNLGENLFNDITVTQKDRTNKLISLDGDKITVNKKTIPHLAWDGIIYPFKILPFDMLNGSVELLGKVPGFKNWSKNILSTDFFKNIRQRSKIDKKINSLAGMITYHEDKVNDAVRQYMKTHNGIKPNKEEMEKIIAKVDENMATSVFQTTSKQFDFKTGNYDTKHERALNRLVSGLPPAIFLANDAYNLSRMMDDDSTAAEKERRTRFKQEASRILTSGYLTLITMGAFQKFINKSKFGIVLTTGITVLVTEMFSRLSNGKHITRLTPEKAREINEKENAPEKDIKPNDNKGQISSTGLNMRSEKPKEQQKPLLSFDTLMKASATVLAIGYGIKGFKNIPKIQEKALKYFENMKVNNPEKYKKLKIENLFTESRNDFKQMYKDTKLSDKEIDLKNAVEAFEKKVIYRPFTDLYKKLTTEKFIIDKTKFDKTVEILKQHGYGEFAQKYEAVGNSKDVLKEINGQQILDLGMKDKKVKPAVNFVIAPFKFMWNTITLPYWVIDKKIGDLFRVAKPKKAPKEVEYLAKSIEKITKKTNDLATGKMTPKEFEDFIRINMTNAFNKDSMSNVSNAELSNLAKTAATAATIWFLMTDNYNMVMLKSNGNDKEGASTKFKERFVQEGSRLFYQTLLIDLFNSTFRNSYNASLLGMSWVTLADTTLGEMLTRSSVGIPIKAHTRDELIDIETKQNNSKGFMKKYYNFMQRLTGKRSIKTYEVNPKNSPAFESAKTIPASLSINKSPAFSQNSLLEQMIKEK